MSKMQEPFPKNDPGPYVVATQSIFKSPVFIAAVLVNIFGVLYLVVSPETAVLLKAIVGAVLAILDVYAAGNNATNPSGFGPNKIQK